MAIDVDPPASAHSRGSTSNSVATPLGQRLQARDSTAASGSVLRQLSSKDAMPNWLTGVQDIRVDRGGPPGRTVQVQVQGNRMHNRGVQSIDRGVSLNRATWMLAEGMRELKR
ncbi:hypothetical protein [Roseateles sp.]|uniref:hypothetical protein n=1 Tax=Roseateles sp. TaxID=1971397 RepID=UPI0039EA8894